MKYQSERMYFSVWWMAVLKDLRTMKQRGLAILQVMLLFSKSMVCIESGSNHLLTTSAMEALRLTFWRGSWIRFLVHAGMLDCKLSLSETLVPTMSSPWNCWVLPDGSHSSRFRIKLLRQCMILHTSWSALEICSSNTLCRLSLSSYTTSFLSLLSGNFLITHLRRVMSLQPLASLYPVFYIFYIFVQFYTLITPPSSTASNGIPTLT